MTARAHRYRSARRDPALAVLEGFHPLKHALRFGAEILEAVTADEAAVLGLAAQLAPDLSSVLPGLLVQVSPGEIEHLAAAPTAPAVVALARRPEADPAALLDHPGPRPVVLLDRPNHLGNLGAAVRAAAAAGAVAVVTTGERDPWDPAALRGSAGLHFALPVARLPGPLPERSRLLVAVDPQGAPLWEAELPESPVLAFGGERHGLGQALLASAHRTVGIPMEPGVSSLNLATSVAVVLFEMRRRGLEPPAPPLSPAGPGGTGSEAPGGR